MIKVLIYVNNRRDPICKFNSEGGEVLKHQIASHILLFWDHAEPITKLRVKIEEV